MMKVMKLTHMAGVAAAALSLAAFRPALAQTGPNGDPQIVSRAAPQRTAPPSIPAASWPYIGVFAPTCIGIQVSVSS